MQRLKIDKVFKVFIAAVVTITSLNVFNVILTANEEFNIDATVTYSEDNKEAVISLDVTSIDEKYVLEEIKDPTGEVMDLLETEYSVDTNGEYDFILTYYDEDNVKSEYVKKVEVTDISTDEIELGEDDSEEELEMTTQEIDSEEDSSKSETVVDRSSLTKASYTSQVTVTNWDLLDTNGDPLSTTNIAKSYSYYQYVVEWELTPSGGAVLHENDTFTISLPVNGTVGRWLLSTSSWENFTDTNNVVLGQWRVNNGNIEVQLGANVEGKQTISGNFTTGKSAAQNSTSAGGIQNVTSGGMTKQILFEQQTLGAIGTNDSKVSNSVSNSRVQWTLMVNNQGVTELGTQPWGTNFTVQNDTYVEDVLNGEYAGGLSISAYFQNPVNLTTGTASGTGTGISVTNKFTKVDQVSAETYTTFKNRLNPFEYGVYEDALGVQTLVINFGDIGNNGMKYSDLDSNFANTFANNGINRGFYTESDRADLIDYFTQAYGDGNAIGGQVAKYRVDFNEDYPKVISDSSRGNTAIFTKNGTSVTKTASGTLQGVASGSVITVDAYTAKVFLSDVDTSSVLNGVTMKLQIQSGGNWIDYTGWAGGTISSDGSVETSALGYGTYRFIQQDAYSNDYDLANSAGYDSSEGKVVSSTFTVASSDTQGHVVYMTNVKKKFTVKYEPGAYGTFSTITNSNIVINSSTPAYNGTVGTDGKPSGSAGYEFAGWSPTLDSTVTADATYVAQWVPLTSTAYKVEHYVEQVDGTYALKETDNLTGSTGATVSATNTTYDGYYFDSSVSNTVESGTILGDGSLTLKLYYKARTNVTYRVQHYLEQPNGLYALQETENLTGTTAHTVTATSKTYAGYTYNSGISGTQISGAVAGDGSLILKLYYKANTDTAYKVEHYQQQVDGTYNLKDTDNLTGMTGATISATSKTYTGYTINLFHTDAILNGSINGDGSLTLKLYYDANTNTAYKVEHYVEQADGTYTLKETDNLTGTTAHTVTATSKTYAGYTFDNTVANTKVTGIVAGDGSLTLKLFYKANTNTAYKIEHYLENADGTYKLEETENKTGTTGSSITAVSKTYVGYTFDSTVANTKVTGSITGDGTLVLKLYYTANTNTKYKVEHYVEQNDGTYALKDTDNLTGTTGSSVSAGAKTYTGYTLSILHANTQIIGTVVGDESLTLKLYYSADTVGYKVEHYLEQADGTYALEDTETPTGKTGYTVTASSKTYVGYTFDNSVTNTKITGTVAGDGSLTLKLYYSADTVSYKVEHYIEDADGTYKLKDTENLTGKSGASVSAITKTYTGYTFDNTVANTKTSGTVAGDGSLVLKVYYSADTVGYKVEHYLEQSDGSYVLQDTDNKTEKTGYIVIASQKAYTGYTLNLLNLNTVQTGTVAGNGSLTLKLYYKADTVGYKVEHYLEQGDGTYVLEDTETPTGKTGYTATGTAKTYAGYTHDSTVGGTVKTGTIAGDGSLVLKLYYKANTNINYKVEHYIEQPNGLYALQDTEALTGSTGYTVNAVVRTYTGYVHNSGVSETVLSGSVKADGSLVLKVYYDASTVDYKVEHYLEQPDGSYALQDTDNLTEKTGSTVNAVRKTYAGYTWNFLNSSTVTSGTVLGDGSLTLRLYYSANTNTAYTVEYLLEQPDGSYALQDMDDLTGTTGHMVNAVQNSYVGYTLDSTIAGTMESGAIAGDGSLTLKLYYTANTDTAYKVEHYLEQPNGTYMLEEVVGKEGTTGHTISAVDNAYAGYTLDTTVVGTVESGVIAGDGTLTLKLYYKANTDTVYKVEHYLEQLDGTYVLTETEAYTGITGDIVTVYPKTYTGYESATLLSRVSTLFISDVIKGDGSLVFEIHYTLNRYSVTYQPGEHGTFDEETFTNVAYGADTPNLSVDITGDTGYEFAGWSPVVDETVSKDSTYVATWTTKKDTAYTVEYYQQQKDGTYKLVESDAMTGETDTTVFAEIKEYKGFNFASTVEDTVLGGVIAGDGSLVLRLYYDIERTFEYKPSTATPGKNSGTNTSTNVSNSSTTSSGVGTSDQTNINLMIMMLLASIGSIVILKKRKTN